MNGEHREDTPHDLTQDELAWIETNLVSLRRTVSGQQTQYWTLVIAFVVGLAAHAGGYLVKVSTTSELVGLLADLVYALGWALWTGVIVVLFVQIVPEIKRRQIGSYLDAYDAAVAKARSTEATRK